MTGVAAAPLPTCPYRRGHQGHLICTVAQSNGGSTSNVITASVCQECEVPQRLGEVNCKHLQCGTEVYFSASFGSTLAEQFYTCSIYALSDTEQLFAQCLSGCPGRTPIHRDVGTLRMVENLPTTPTDRDIRQGVLLSLFQYHADHPERFLDFDVTPAQLAASLNVDERSIQRVLGPMDEAGEIRSIKAAADVLPRFVTITHQGIQALNDEPLFENKGIKMTDNSIKIEGNNNQVARDHSRNEQVNIQASAPALEDLVRALQDFRG